MRKTGLEPARECNPQPPARPRTPYFKTAARCAAGAISCSQLFHAQDWTRTSTRLQSPRRRGRGPLRFKTALRCALRCGSDLVLAAFSCARLDSNQHEIAIPSRWRGRGPLTLRPLRAARCAAGAISCSQLFHAQDWTRTSTRLLPLAPQASASTNSATCAHNADRSTTASGRLGASTFRD